MQDGILFRDCKTQSSSTHRALTSWVRSPETIEDSLQLLLGHANSTIGNGDCNRLGI